MRSWPPAAIRAVTCWIPGLQPGSMLASVTLKVCVQCLVSLRCSKKASYKDTYSKLDCYKLRCARSVAKYLCRYTFILVNYTVLSYFSSKVPRRPPTPLRTRRFPPALCHCTLVTVYTVFPNTAALICQATSVL